jgi:trimethylamine--corrinoid protein Co-methyltransferase
VHEVLHMVNQYVRGIAVNDETLALEIINQVGPGGHYLQQEHTLEHFRDVWYSRLFDRSIYAQWLEQGAQDFEERLQAQTQKAMAHQPTPLPAEILTELERMEKGWE